ncbi:MAG TPA: AMP-binding protein [Thermoanaerobaculia bacterium]|nr:AMP-binding protein [Thermoanaerobaculia bacterium]
MVSGEPRARLSVDGVESDEHARALLDLVRGLAVELRPDLSRREVRLDSSLERELGLDSLSRVELVQRLEQRFGGLALAEEEVMVAETPADLLALVRSGAVARPPTPDRALRRLDAEPEAGRLRGAGVSGHRRPVARAPERARTLVEVLEWHADRHPERLHVLLHEDDRTVSELSYGRLLESAREVAAGLAERGIEPGQPVAVMLPTSLDYFASFYGILLLGAIPVPLYPPVRPSQLEDHLRRQVRILQNCQARLLVTVPEARMLARILEAQVPTLRGIATVGDLRRPGERGPWHAHGEEEIAFLQYTSGSTGEPKGVVLSHRNLLANVRAILDWLEITSEDRCVSWLPLYHDMGLIGAGMGSLYGAFPLVLMSPLSFLSRPVRWLERIGEHRGTVAAGPNFAYELCSSKIRDEELEGLDLSTWRLALNGAEAVLPATLERFAERFAPVGFRREAWLPVYGLAESSLGVAFPPAGRGPRIDRVRRVALAAGIAEPVDRRSWDEPGDGVIGQSGRGSRSVREMPATEMLDTEMPDTAMLDTERSGRSAAREDRAPAAEDDRACVVELPSCGMPLAGHEIRVADERGREHPERVVGRIQFRGPSASRGYYRNPEATRRLFDGDWLQSGDLGYVADGELYVTGREKDLIIRSGRNLSPEEIEEATGAVEGVRPGCVAAFGLAATSGGETGTERLVVVAETRAASESERDAIQQRILGAVADRVGVAPDEVVLATPGTVLKTSSGKIRRSTMRELYSRRALSSRRAGVLRQTTALALASVIPALRQMLRGAARRVYTLWVYSCFVLVGLPLWIVSAALPGLGVRQAALRASARLMVRLAFVRFRARGLEHVPALGAAVIAANHTSYSDVIFLVAALPPGSRFIAKREWARVLPVRWLFERAGCVFVERFDPKRSAEDAEQILELLRAGDRLVVFPEGTFSRRPGLLPFRMGAFRHAAQTGTPVIPAVLRGPRSLMRDKQLLLHRRAVSLAVLEPVAPRAADWQAALALRDEVRAAILARCGEPDLAAVSERPE